MYHWLCLILGWATDTESSQQSSRRSGTLASQATPEGLGYLKWRDGKKPSEHATAKETFITKHAINLGVSGHCASMLQCVISLQPWV